MKKVFFISGSMIITILCFCMFSMSNIAEAQIITDPGEGQTCKWQQIRCKKGGFYEGCLNNGDGNTCECGATTRDCN